MPEAFEFSDITIFYGNNGSGKSTILNVISERLKLKRDTLCNRSDFFDDYAELCKYTLQERISPDSRVITSDDVFERVLDIRKINSGIDTKRESIINEWVELRSGDTDTQLHGIDDYDRWKKVGEMRNRHNSQSSFLRKNLMRNIQERSNGESALAYFVDSIQSDTL